ncbi:MAG: hypothetical protein LBF23_03025, partial [Endomicrobium sp.]|nr:hypothetical protein [Endomicrobium sp.]
PNSHKKSGNYAPPSIIVPLDLPQSHGKSKNESELFGPELISEASSFPAGATPANMEPGFEASLTSRDPDNPTVTPEELKDAIEFHKNTKNNYIRSLEKENKLLNELMRGLLILSCV